MKPRMKAKHTTFAASLIIASLFAWFGWSFVSLDGTGGISINVTLGSDTERKEGEYAKVFTVVDGDTFVLEGGEKVRMIGMNAPERGEPFYDEAKWGLMKLILNKEVRLQKDVSDKDKYERMLRYVYIGNTLVNEEILKQGFARVLTIPPDITHVQTFLSAERVAREKHVGMWGSDQ